MSNADFWISYRNISKNMHLILKSKFPEKFKQFSDPSDSNDLFWLRDERCNINLFYSNQFNEKYEIKRYCLICDKLIGIIRASYFDNINQKVIDHGLKHLKEYNLLSFT